MQHNLGLIMENQSVDQIEMETEEFPDEFQCCVCLDILYKPIVLACGHISCFWCVCKAMDFCQESNCPVCRNPYNHFPRICRLFHILLLNLYPSAYKKKGEIVAEEEKQCGHASPQFEDDLLDSQSNDVLEVQDPSHPLLKDIHQESNTTCRGETPMVRYPETTFPGEDNIITIPKTPPSQTTASAGFHIVKLKHTNISCLQVLAKILQCAVCKQLLCRPLVLNCGHVYCEACINNRHDSACRCPLCQSAHPRGFPNVCLVLEHFLEENFPKEYSLRKESLANNSHSGNPSTSLLEKQEKGAQDSSVHENPYSSLICGSVPNFHLGVGCDYCGMCPLIGKRYKCKDCKEKMGFDLCEGCYNSSFKLPGRFNQQHTEDHQFNLIYSHGGEHYEENDITFVNPDIHEEPILVPNMVNDALDDEEIENSVFYDQVDDDFDFSPTDLP